MYYGMSLASCPEPSIVVDRGLALHKVLRLLVLGLGGTGWDGGMVVEALTQLRVMGWRDVRVKIFRISSGIC